MRMQGVAKITIHFNENTNLLFSLTVFKEIFHLEERILIISWNLDDKIM